MIPLKKTYCPVTALKFPFCKTLEGELFIYSTYFCDMRKYIVEP